MLHKLHLFSGSILLLSHMVFLFRSIYLLKTEKSPAQVDKITMFLSQILLPVTIISGLGRISEASFIHILPGLLPIVFMFVLARKSLRRKKPLLLPMINGICLLAAFVTGVFL